ncbi:TPA: ubiquinone biosynthesis regulatory protein kinase UbiB [Legionella pneumophila]|uniref:ubiquinone biosynthesis regulatory protein kinase UbiB n=1 Tax=Legionella pneumophila TaxID=446 RepID=UPI0007889E2F|nr:ubiquinone biosynthesis regulatory protein kinase UbiB [Legionella pneumophila]MDW8878716.1 ubiquinone biosynthesis regulatory protein kinase UbiB [Legionella pneumophila subsp. fraseri]MDW8962970.1 ubiquinone biosynthesis regulatory protein kinase UbiB [Legionella pneumophila subsp. fraseri]MDW9035440.1 ubiquinone biosynthesis regulatory protein kinase UbiB [Legionella pneumophila subsp. fraseri]MDW9038501.1 ubiquinone biosynthesis regulatory protein kinase UbiB [Legionella pneumophila subs
MKSIKQLIRLIHINYILAKNGLDNVVVSIKLFAPLRFIVYLNPWNWFRKEKLTRGEALRKSLEELGPIFIKFGQALSTRPDILPEDIAKELSKLQDKVPPFPSHVAMTIIEQAYKKSAYDVFAQFDPVALASASMAQVHAATLKTGENVVVKILRPNMRRIIEQDLSIMYTIATLADRYWPEGKRFKPKEIVKEFEHTLLDELDLMREAANAAQLRRNFNQSPMLYIPEIHWDYCHNNILVIERIHGIPVTDIASLRDHGIDIKKLAERGVEIFFTQVFRDCFFHADMHPGNIFVSYQNPKDPQYICVDFGIIGTLTDNDKRYLAENLVAFFNRDYKRVAELHVESGWVARNTPVAEFESSIRTVCEPIFEKPLKDISFGQVVFRLFQVARRFHMEVQPQLILLQKTLLAIEGLGRQLYPELDLWATAKPFLEKWVREQMGPKAFIKRLKQNLPFFTEQLPHMPKLIFDILEMKKDQLLTVNELTRMQSENKNQTIQWKSLGLGVFFSFLSLGVISYFDLLDYNHLTTITIAGSVLAGIFVLINRKIRN